MSLIEKVMPAWRLRQVDRVAVAASPARAWQTVRGLDLYRIELVRALFALRLVPEAVMARLRRRPPPRLTRSRIEDIVAPGSGWLLLGEEVGREVVIGTAGKFWQPRIQYAPLVPETFASFEDPAFGKLAWNLRVDPREGGGSWISVDLRVTAGSDQAWARFQRYWRLVGPLSHAIRRGVLGHLARQLGAAPPEAEMPLPGDDLIEAPGFRRTHARTIEAPPAALWPWLAQMGCRRGGWYSLDRLDNGGVPSADRIVPELQHLAVGDLIPARPRGDEAFAVLRLEPARSLVIGSPSLLSSEAPRPADTAAWRTSWAFALQPIGEDATRLLVRVRAGYEPSARLALVRPALAAVHELMERVQLRNLKRRAEAGV
jgi:hypothetical protein